MLSVLALVFIIANTAVAMRREADTYNSLGAPLSLMAKVSAWQTWIIAGVSMLTGYVGPSCRRVFLSEAPGISITPIRIQLTVSSTSNRTGGCFWWLLQCPWPVPQFLR